MEKLVIQVNSFSRKKLLAKMLPLTMVLSALCLHADSVQLFINLLSLIFIFWLIHPYLINFEQEAIDYFKYLKNQEAYYQKLIDKKRRKLKKCRRTKPLDLIGDRQEFLRLTRALQHHQKEMLISHDDNDFYADFRRDLKRRIIIINDFAILSKKLRIHYLKDNIKTLENRKKDIVTAQHYVLQKAILKG